MIMLVKGSTNRDLLICFVGLTINQTIPTFLRPRSEIKILNLFHSKNATHLKQKVKLLYQEKLIKF